MTGAASGFGAGVSRALAARGAIVIMGDVDEVNGRKVAEELQQNSGELDIDFYNFLPCDVSDMSQVKRLFDFAEEKYGGVDIVINNAGIGSWYCSLAGPAVPALLDPPRDPVAREASSPWPFLRRR